MDIKKKAGRPVSVDVKNNKQYFVEYYHANNISIVCECGLPIMKTGMSHHKNTSKHIFLMKNKVKPESLGDSIFPNLVENIDKLIPLGEKDDST